MSALGWRARAGEQPGRRVQEMLWAGRKAIDSAVPRQMPHTALVEERHEAWRAEAARSPWCDPVIHAAQGLRLLLARLDARPAAVVQQRCHVFQEKGLLRLMSQFHLYSRIMLDQTPGSCNGCRETTASAAARLVHAGACAPQERTGARGPKGGPCTHHFDSTWLRIGLRG